MRKITLANSLFPFKFLRFIIVGLLNTIVGYGIYAGLLYVGIPYSLALLFSTVLGVIFNYFSFARLAFSAKMHWLSFAKFIFSYTLVYLGNLLLLALLIEFTKLDSYISQFICLPINAMMSYIFLNKWVYKGLKNAAH